MLNGLPILLIEDDRVDAMTVERAFDKAGITNPLHTVSDGEQALAFLQRNPRPGLILLDLNMSRMNGVEFLRALKADESLAASIPVVILTSSREERDVCACYRLGAAGYIVKPLEFGEFVDVMRAVDVYWTRSIVPNEPPS
jgi:CheY-like chemotaxis protein